MARKRRGEALVQEAVEQLHLDEQDARALNGPALDDLEKLSGKQWDSKEEERRKRLNIPMLTNNLLQKFVKQVYGNRLLNMTEARVSPDNGGTVAEAEIREELMRSIFRHSEARVALATAFFNQAACGAGYARVEVNESGYDVWDKDIAIEPIYNPLSVIFDRASYEPTGKDAERCFQIESFTDEDFRARWPGAELSDVMVMGVLDRATRRWMVPESHRRVRAAVWYRMAERPATVALMADNTVQDITDVPPELWLPNAKLSEGGEPFVREATRPICERRVISGTEVLESKIERPVSRLPIVRFTGDFMSVGEDYTRWGIVRFLKDSQALNNYWDSAIARLLQMASSPPKYVGTDQAVAGYDDLWKRPWENDSTYLPYKEGTQMPQQQEQMNIHPALFAERERSARYMHDISNMKEASFGDRGGETSRVAIVARQQAAELGSVPLNFNADLATQEIGELVNQYIPHVYDGNRIITATRLEGDTHQVEINAVADEKSRITNAKYRVTVTTGPSYATRAEEQRETLLTALNHAPQAAGLALDKVFESFDTKESRAIARRIRRSPEVQASLSTEEMTEEEQQQAQARQEAEQAAQELQQQMAQAELREKLARAREAEARAEQAEAQAQKAMSEIGVAAKKADTEAKKAAASMTKDEAQAAKTLSEVGVAARQAATQETKINLDAIEAEADRSLQRSLREGAPKSES